MAKKKEWISEDTKNSMLVLFANYIFVGLCLGFLITIFTPTCKEKAAIPYDECYISEYDNHLTPQSFDENNCITIGNIVLWIAGLPFYIVREIVWFVWFSILTPLWNIQIACIPVVSC